MVPYLHFPYKPSRVSSYTQGQDYILYFPSPSLLLLYHTNYYRHFGKYSGVIETLVSIPFTSSLSGDC
jgi:hypothetical protein